MMSLYSLLSGGVFPLGAFWVGFVSEHWGVSRAFLVNGAIGLLSVTALLVGQRVGASEGEAGGLFVSAWRRRG